MKIYIAHNYSARTWLKNEISTIESYGHKVTSKWITDDMHNAGSHECARADLDDIDRADALMLFVDQYGDTPGRGKYVELGYAIGRGKKILLLGNANDCVFLTLRDANISRIKKLEDLHAWH